MANLAAHAVASHAAAKFGAADASAPGNADAAGTDPVFAALLAAASGAANDTGKEDPSKAKMIAELLNHSARHPAAGAVAAAPHGHVSPQDAKGKIVPAIATATQIKQEKTQTGTASTGTTADAAANTPAKSQAKGQHESGAHTAIPPAFAAALTGTTPAQTQASASQQDGTDTATTSGSLVSRLARFHALQATKNPAEQARAAAANGAAKGNASGEVPAGHMQNGGLQSALAALQLAAEKSATAADKILLAHAKAAAQHGGASAAKTASRQTSPAGQAASALAGNAQKRSLETARAALQAAAQKAEAAASNTQSVHGKATGPRSAAFAAAVEAASHQTPPAQQTASTLPSPTPVSFAPAGTQSQPGNTGSGNTGHDAKPQNDQARAAPPKAAGPAATTAGAQPPSHASFHAALQPNTATPAIQAGQVSQPASTSLAANLQVAPQGAAMADGQTVPLTNLGAIAVQIAAQSNNGAKQFNIALHPQDLGSIHVRLSVNHAGTAQAHLSAENPQTLSLLQQDSHALARALRDAGLNLAGNGLNFSLKGQDRQNGGGAQKGGRSRALSVSAVASPSTPAMASTPIHDFASNQVRLDIRV